jgi:mannosyltransferase OCH1-like enzyme
MVSIPKKIIQVWVGDEAKIPEYYGTSLESIERHMVANGWEYKLLKEPEISEFIAREYPDFLETYKKFPHDIQRADAIRPLWLKKYGGLYLDMDFEIMEPLDSLFTADVDAFFIPATTRDSLTYKLGGVLTNSIMASKPGVAVWDKYIEQIKKPTKPWIIGKHLEVMNSTGPIALSKSVAKSSGVYGTLPTKLLSPCSICEVDSCDKHGTMMRQLTGKSWHSIDSTIYNAIFCNFWYIMLGLVFIIVVVWAIRRARS